MGRPDLYLVVPGPIDQRTGGYLYDARIAEGLRRLGWAVEVRSLDGAFPEADPVAARSFALTLAAIPSPARVVVDGLALGAYRESAGGDVRRLRAIALVHHPLADETGLTDAERSRLDAIERAALRDCAGAIVTSRFTARRLAELDVVATRVRVVEPGVDPAPPAAGPAPGEPPHLLCVGSVVPRKGHDVLVDALARLSHCNWRCSCVGSLTRDADFARSVVSAAGRLGLADRIDFVGECDADALEDYYHTASLLVLPSRNEGYGMVLDEAFARGLPVVSTRAGAIPDVVPASAGVLVTAGDAAELAGALDSLIGGVGANARLSALTTGARSNGRALRGWGDAADAFAAALLELAPDA